MKRGTSILLLLMIAAGSNAAQAPSSPRPLGRAAELCRLHAVLDACYDAIRRNPDDARLLMAMRDALERANRPAEALRYYRRAAALQPNLHGLAAKISTAEARKTPGKTAAPVVVAASPRHPMNSDPPAQSH